MAAHNELGKEGELLAANHRRLLAQIRHRPSGTLRPYHHRNGRKRASPAKAYRGRLLPAAILTATRLEYFEYDAFTLHTGRFAMV